MTFQSVAACMRSVMETVYIIANQNHFWKLQDYSIHPLCRQYIYGGIGTVFYMFAMDFAVPTLRLLSQFPFPMPNPDRPNKLKIIQI